MSGGNIDRMKTRPWGVDTGYNWRAVCDAAGVAHDTDPADVVRAIQAQVLHTVDAELTQAVEEKQSSSDPNPLSWQTGALWGRDRVRTRAAVLEDLHTNGGAP